MFLYHTRLYIIYINIYIYNLIIIIYRIKYNNNIYILYINTFPSSPVDEKIKSCKVSLYSLNASFCNLCNFIFWIAIISVVVKVLPNNIYYNKYIYIIYMIIIKSIYKIIYKKF